MLASRGTCCEVGSEYIASKNECMLVRPERRCLAGHLDDCVQAGRELENEGGMGANYASELYRFACEEGHAAGCRGLGAMYRIGKGLDKDEGRGRELYEQACSMGDAPACTQVARWMLGEKVESHATAIALLTQACHRGDAQACADFAQQLGADPSKREQQASYLARACEGGAGAACRSLLQHERAAASVKPGRELELLTMACTASDAEGCLILGDAFRDGLIAPQSSVAAAQRYRLACDAGHLTGCMRLADVTAEGDGVSRDLPRAAQLYGQLCGEGVQLACERKTLVESEQRREILRASRAR
jgi:TPR repeat protein